MTCSRSCFPGFDGAAHGVHSTCAVAGGFDNTPAMLGDLQMDQLTSMFLQLRERSFLVGPFMRE
jgi:hypothetical protein